MDVLTNRGGGWWCYSLVESSMNGPLWGVGVSQYCSCGSASVGLGGRGTWGAGAVVGSWHTVGL
jgi:hypothetical protein